MQRLRYVHTVFILFTMTTLSFSQADQLFPGDPAKNRCLLILENAMKDSADFFVSVHAAEALIAHQDTMGIEKLFKTRLRESDANRVGCYRVLAKLNGTGSAGSAFYIRRLKGILLNADIKKEKLIALESLAKLGFKEPLPVILQLAENGEAAFKSISRWILANSGNAADEKRLTEMFTSDRPDDRLYAAYAFRFLKHMSHENYAFLDSCTNRLDLSDPNRINFVCARYVHSDKEDEAKAKAAVLHYIDGNKEERYELAEALSLRGSRADLPVLNKLLQDESKDVRVAAANAWLWINFKKSSI